MNPPHHASCKVVLALADMIAVSPVSLRLGQTAVEGRPVAWNFRSGTVPVSRFPSHAAGLNSP